MNSRTPHHRASQPRRVLENIHINRWNVLEDVTTESQKWGRYQPKVILMSQNRPQMKLNWKRTIYIYLISKLRIDDRLLKLYKNVYSNLEVERDLISTLHRDEMERSQHVRIWKQVVVTPVRETQRKSWNPSVKDIWWRGFKLWTSRMMVMND